MTLKHRFFFASGLSQNFVLLYLLFRLFCFCFDFTFLCYFFSFVVISFFTFILQAFRDVRTICKLVFFSRV